MCLDCVKPGYSMVTIRVGHGAPFQSNEFTVVYSYASSVENNSEPDRA